MKKLSFLFLTIGIIWGCWAESPKREFRATWLASVSNIDWPKSTQTSEEQKAALIKILDGMQAARMNAVWLQVRPMSDALYNSAYEPWSKFLTGTRGVDPGYDPLAFAIEEAHKRGMELHAWINPYRYESEKNMNGADDSIRKNHPEWLLEYSSSFILDPGNPEVIESPSTMSTVLCSTITFTPTKALKMKMPILRVYINPKGKMWGIGAVRIATNLSPIFTL